MKGGRRQWRYFFPPPIRQAHSSLATPALLCLSCLASPRWGSGEEQPLLQRHCQLGSLPPHCFLHIRCSPHCNVGEHYNEGGRLVGSSDRHPPGQGGSRHIRLDHPAARGKWSQGSSAGPQGKRLGWAAGRRPRPRWWATGKAHKNTHDRVRACLSRAHWGGKVKAGSRQCRCS